MSGIVGNAGPILGLDGDVRDRAHGDRSALPRRATSRAASRQGSGAAASERARSRSPSRSRARDESAAVELWQDADGTVRGRSDADGATLEAAVRQAARSLSLDHDGTGWPAVGERDPIVGAAAARARPPPPGVLLLGL